jgi:Tol biopolymer transport system component
MEAEWQATLDSTAEFLRGGSHTLLFLTLATSFLCGGDSRSRIRSVAISPDGKLIAVDHGDGKASYIYRVPVDTGAATRFTNASTGNESSPAFSPDGKRIAYSYSVSAGVHSAIAVGNADGSDLHTWSPSEANNYFSPVFSPDGKTLVFAKSGFYGNYSPIAQPQPHAWSFYASEFDGTNLRELTSESFYMASPASVSPDGKSMVIVQESLDTNRAIAIYSLDHPGKPIQLLRPHVPKEADHKNPLLNFPNYMPDGKSILFMAGSDGKHGYDYDVYRVNLATGSLDRLTTGNGYATDLKVSADGKTAVFLKWQSDWHGTPVKSEVYLLDVQSHKVTELKITGLE